jgi:hypothetical protein
LTLGQFWRRAATAHSTISLMSAYTELSNAITSLLLNFLRTLDTTASIVWKERERERENYNEWIWFFDFSLF